MMLFWGGEKLCVYDIHLQTVVAMATHITHQTPLSVNRRASVPQVSALWERLTDKSITITHFCTDQTSIS